MWQTGTVRASWLSCVMLALTWTSPCALAVRAAELWPSFGLNNQAAEKTICKALGEDTRMEFIETPLEDVVAFLRDQHDIPIQIEPRRTRVFHSALRSRDRSASC